MESPYGYELIIDLEDCDIGLFNRTELDRFFAALCKEIDMVKCERFWWDDVGVRDAEKQTSPHAKGTSAVQFILTSSIVIHTLDLTGQVFLNIFSCKPFSVSAAKTFATRWFRAKAARYTFLTRG